MYALIYKNQQLIGLFTSKKKMRETIEMLIKESFEDTGVHGNYHFRYTEIEINQIDYQCVSFFTMHPEKFEYEIETDWNTGEIIKI
jgi:hypothetical protein